MTLEIKNEGNTTEIAVIGRLDTVSSPELDELIHNLGGTEELVLDFDRLDYISSAGLRVLLSAEKLMKDRSGMRIRNVNETVMEVFEITGFTEILTIE